MAKRQTPSMSDIFKKTPPDQAPGDNSDLDQGNIKPVGVGITGGEIAAVEAIAAEKELTRNAILHWAIRYFIIQYRAGKINIETEAPPPPKRKAKMPK
jgi:hypothetical protein